jgi:hypothetical protein
MQVSQCLAKVLVAPPGCRSVAGNCRRLRGLSVLRRPARGLCGFAVRRARASEVLHPSRCSPRLARAACPSAASARCWSAQAPRSNARCANQRRCLPGLSTVRQLGASCASALALSAEVAPAACPAWSAQAPRSWARCPSSAALPAMLGHSHAQRVLLSLASCEASNCCSIGTGKLTVVNASQFVGCASAKAAPNPSVKRTAPGLPASAAYLKR